MMNEMSIDLSYNRLRFRTRPVEEELDVESSETGGALVDADAGTGAIKE